MKSVGKNAVFMAAAVAVAVSAVAMISPSFLNHTKAPSGGNVYQDMMRFNEVLTTVSRYYVDDVNTKNLIDGAISGMLETLDPHSVFIPKEQLEDVTENFEGHFFGVGIEFGIIKKWPTIIAPLSDSPSDRLGLRTGDQIIEIEDKSAYNLTEKEIMERLRGPRGTQVRVTIRRPGLEEPFKVAIQRDKISINSVEPAFLLNPNTGYVRVKRFSKTTTDELEEALAKLEAQGVKQLILDLRSNAGGFLEQAVSVADKFLERGKKVVYTRGRISQSNDDFYATDDDHHGEAPLIILIDHGSASASEIVAGACQDWDRALIVGETSFGKGLVQSQFALKDGSAIRVTTAKYYTPSGRLIQRPYESGSLEDYISEAYDDVDPNDEPDTVAHRPVYMTSGGRQVYGGGGVTPDVKLKWHRYSRFTYDLVMNRVFFEFAAEFANRNRHLANDFQSFLENWSPSEKVMADFRNLVEAKNIRFDQQSWDSDAANLKLWLKKEIALHLWDRDKSALVEIHNDPQFKEVIDLFPQAIQLAALNESGSPDGRALPKTRPVDGYKKN